MIDDDHGDAERADRDQDVRQPGGLRLRQAGGRLVEQQHLRPGEQHPGQFDHLLRTSREGGGRGTRPFGQIEGGEQGRNLVRELRRPAPGAFRTAAVGGFRPDQHIVEHVEVREDAGRLKGPGDAEPGDPVRLPAGPGDRRVADHELAVVGRVDAGEQVEQGGLARPVGADDTGDGPGLGGERHVVDRDDAAERLGELAGLKPARTRTSPSLWRLGLMRLSRAIAPSTPPSTPLGARLSTTMTRTPSSTVVHCWNPCEIAGR